MRNDSVGQTALYQLAARYTKELAEEISDLHRSIANVRIFAEHRCIAIQNLLREIEVLRSWEAGKDGKIKKDLEIK